MDGNTNSASPLSLKEYANDRFALLLPAGDGWRTAHLRRTYSCRNIVRTNDETTVTVTLYPRVRAGGMYKDGNDFLRHTERLPPDITVERRRGHRPIAITRYTNRSFDRYYALIEDRAMLLEVDCTTHCGAVAPPIEEIVASTHFHEPEAAPSARWETVALPGFTVIVPAGWEQKDEYNRRFDLPFVTDARGIAVARADPVYATRQMSPPQYRVQALAPGRNLRSYLVGLKTERHKSSIDGATYQLLGEDRVRSKQVSGTRLRYQGYSPGGIRGPMEWYHELLLLEIGPLPFLLTAYCDWIERHIYAPMFAHMTHSLSPRDTRHA